MLFQMTYLYSTSFVCLVFLSIFHYYRSRISYGSHLKNKMWSIGFDNSILNLHFQSITFLFWRWKSLTHSIDSGDLLQTFLCISWPLLSNLYLQPGSCLWNELWGFLLVPLDQAIKPVLTYQIDQVWLMLCLKSMACWLHPGQ